MEDTERKRRHLNNHTSLSPPMKKPHPMTMVTEEKKVDPGMLQYQNQKLAQQLEVQKIEIHALEERFSQLKSKQTSFDETLIAVNRCWSEMVDDLELLLLRVQPCATALTVLDAEPAPLDEKPKTPEETFLQRFIGSSSTEGDGLDAAIAARKASTLKVMKRVVESIEAQRAKNDELSSQLRNLLSADDAANALQKVDDELRAESQNLIKAIDTLHLRHKDMSSSMRALEESRFKDQAEIARLTVELEETFGELESSRRKLAGSRIQSAGPPTPSAVKDQGEKNSFKSSKEVKDLEDALGVARDLADRRLLEIQEAHRNTQILSEQLHKLQDSHMDEQRVLNSQQYVLLLDQVKFLKAEVDRLQANVDRVQAERDSALRHEKEVSLKAEAGEAAKRLASVTEARIADLESKLEQCMSQRDEMQTRVDELTQLSGRKDTVAELKVMINTLHKEMGMMQAQLNKYKEIAQEVCTLRADAHSLADVLDRKTLESKTLSKKVTDQAMEAEALKEEIKRVKESEQELKLILDMYEKESVETRDLLQIQQSECRALAQIQRLKEALDEHSLELRVKTANEAEAACQLRLAAAEAEIADLRQRLDASDRDKLELVETIKAKNEEGETYISEIETIGQAYEDMQTQNQRLLNQIAERDDFNTKLVAESLKAKQLQTSLVTEKQLISGKMQQATSVADVQKQRVSRLEEQIRAQHEQVSKAAEDSRQAASALEVAKRKLAEVERESLSLKAALELSEKEVQDRASKKHELLKDLEKERYDKRRLEEELTSWRNKQVRHSVSHDVEEELRKYRMLLRCGVCSDRQKEVAITKCFHLFCSPCIQKNLETRHRKCPVCGVGFGQGDVKTVYI